MDDVFFLVLALVLFGAAGVLVRERRPTRPETRS